MLIRNLKQEDRIGWISMRAKLWPEAPIDELINDTFIITSDDYFEECQRKWKVFILEENNDKICGFVEVSLRPSDEYCNTSPIGFIEGLYIEGSVRRNGFGRKLIEKAEEWARSEGCTEMASDIDAYRRAGIEAHKALGYVITFRDGKKVKFRKKFKK